MYWICSVLMSDGRTKVVLGLLWVNNSYWAVTAQYELLTHIVWKWLRCVYCRLRWPRRSRNIAHTPSNVSIWLHLTIFDTISQFFIGTSHFPGTAEPHSLGTAEPWRLYSALQGNNKCVLLPNGLKLGHMLPLDGLHSISSPTQPPHIMTHIP